MKTWIPLIILLLLWSSGLIAQGAGYALDFNGSVGDNVNCGSDFFSTSNLTIEAWVRPDEIVWFPPGGDGLVISDGDGSNTGINIDLQASHIPHCYINTSIDGIRNVTGSSLTESVWSHIAMVFNGSSIIIYQNGSPITTENLPSGGGQTIILGGSNVMIGAMGTLSSRFFLGAIDEVRIWNAALDQTTINTWKNVPVTSSHPDWSNMLAYYQFNEGSGTSCSDTRGIQSAATNNNATWIVNSDLALPVEMALFEANPSENGETVALRWITASELDNLGFEILRRAGAGMDWQIIDSYTTNPDLAGQGTVSNSTTYQYSDFQVDKDQFYQYCIVNVTVNGDKEYSQVVDVSLASTILDAYQLHPAYPNPFNPETILTFDIKDYSYVTLQIYDLTGRLIKTLVNQSMNPGQHQIQWNGTNLSGVPAASGIYFVQLNAGGEKKVTKVSLIR